MSKSRKGLEKTLEVKDFSVEIDEKIDDKMIALVRVESDNGSLEKTVYCRAEHEFSLNHIMRRLNPKEYIKIIFIKKVGESLKQLKF